MGQAQLLAFLESWCNHLLYRLDIAQIPTNLHKIARELGVRDVRMEPLEVWGFVERVAGELIIHLKNDVPTARHRFSFAHELGHVLLERLRDQDGTSDFKKFRTHAAVASRLSEEFLADHIAACLLLPTWFMRSSLGDDLSIHAIERASRRAQTSLSAALLRAVGMATEPCVAFLCRSVGDKSLRVLWSSQSSSVPGVAVKTDLANPLVLDALIGVGQADELGLALRWIDCQHVVREFEGIRNIFGLARVRPAYIETTVFTPKCDRSVHSELPF